MDKTPEQAKEELLVQVRAAAAEEAKKFGGLNAEGVKGVVDGILGNMPIEALRAYAQDKETLNESVRTMAAKIDTFQQTATRAAEVRAHAIMDAMDAKLPGEDKSPWQKIEIAMRNASGSNNRGDIFSLNVRAAAAMTLGNTVDETTFNVPAVMVESMSMAAFVPKRRGDQFIYDLADRTVVDQLTQYKTWLEEGSEEGAFAIVAEGAVKPLVSAGLVRNYAKAKKVAGKYVVTEEFAKFRKEAYNIIRRIITDKMLRDYSALLVIDLNAQAAGYVGTTLDGTFTKPTDFDAIGAVAAQIETLNFAPDVLVIHPQDKWRLTLASDSQGRYFMMIPVQGADGVVNLMGFRVVTSTYQTAGSFTLGESGLFKIEEEAITVRMGYGIDVAYTTVNGTQLVQNVVSDFDTNKMRLIIETWFNDWIATPHIGSYVKASFTNMKAALLKVA